MATKKQKNKNNIYVLTLVLFFPILIALWFMALFLPVVGGMASFPLKSIECGHQPYIADRFAGSATYTTPRDKLYRGPDVFTKQKDYYCTEAAAQEAGNKAILWSEKCNIMQDKQPARCVADGDGVDAVVPFFAVLILVAGGLSYITSLTVLKRRASPKK